MNFNKAQIIKMRMLSHLFFYLALLIFCFGQAYASDPLQSSHFTDIFLDSQNIIADGSKDVSSQLQCIFNNLKAGERLIFPKDKIYRIDKPIFIKNSQIAIKMDSNSVLNSEWKPTVVGLDGLLVVEGQNIYLENININGNGNLNIGIVVRYSNNVTITGGHIFNTGLAGIKIGSSEHCTIEKVWFDECMKSLNGDTGRTGAIDIGHTGWTQSKTSDSRDITVQGCTVTNSYGKGVHIQFADRCKIISCITETTMHNSAVGFYAGYQAKNVLFFNCISKKCKGGGIKISSGASNTTIQDCNIINPEFNGILVQGGNNATISNCSIKISGNHNGITVAGHPEPTGSNSICVAVKNNIILQSMVNNTSTGILVENHAGQYFSDSTLLQNNSIKGFCFGIQQYSGPEKGGDHEIIENRIFDFTNTGIEIGWNARNIAISNNIIESSASKTCGIGIAFKPYKSKTNFRISSNKINVTNGTCINFYNAEKISITYNDLSGALGINFSSGVKDANCADNHIVGVSSQTGTGINMVDNQNINLKNNTIKKFNTGILSKYKIPTADKDNKISDCGSSLVRFTK